MTIGPCSQFFAHLFIQVFSSFKDGGLVHIANGLTDQANNDTGGLGSIVLWNLGLTHEAMFGFCDALVSILAEVCF